MNHKAFTLIELLVVVAIIGILAAVGVVAYNGYTKAAKINADNTSGVAIVLACETDFVAKNDSFKELTNQFAEIALNYKDKASFLAADFGGMSVAEKLIEQTGVIGEKIEISEF